MSKTNWTVTKTGRGFERCDFRDAGGKPCSLQQSSAIDIDNWNDASQKPGSSFVWLGREGDRMHLHRDQALLLSLALSAWLEHGTFVEPPPCPVCGYPTAHHEKCVQCEAMYESEQAAHEDARHD